LGHDYEHAVVFPQLLDTFPISINEKLSVRKGSKTKKCTGGIIFQWKPDRPSGTHGLRVVPAGRSIRLMLLEVNSALIWSLLEKSLFFLATALSPIKCDISSSVSQA